MSTRVTYSRDGGKKESSVCFSEPWRVYTKWKELTYYPTLYNGFKAQYFDEVGMDFPAVVSYWDQALKTWGLNLFGNTLSAETWEDGYTIPNTLPDSSAFVALTAIRYLDEYQEVIYQMIRLGVHYPDIFAGSGENLWNAFCTAHTGALYKTDFMAENGHMLIPDPDLRVYPGDGNLDSYEGVNVLTIWGSFPPVIPKAPKRWGDNSAVPPEQFLSEVITFLRAKE